MKKFEQAIKQAELALSKGEYKNCIEIINDQLDLFPPDTREGINIRFILITAFSGISQNEKAIVLCKELLKSNNNLIKEEARSLIQILSSPNLKTPEDWNVKFENDLDFSNKKNFSLKNKKNFKKQQKYINTENKPTGETRTFQKGFIVITFVLLFLLLSLLSGCVKINSTLDLREIDSINVNFDIENKYLSKFPWQINFENKLSDFFPNKQIISNKDLFSLKKTGLNLEEVNLTLNKILKSASNNSKSKSKGINIKHYENNFLLGKKYYFDIAIDLTNINETDNLEMYLNIIYPSKLDILGNEPNLYEVNKKEKIISWRLIPEKSNKINFSFWGWNDLLIGTLGVILLVSTAYFVMRKRYELGSDLPKLPS
tara:strand:- start:2285 stop:3400 length:1116 start_codon:yes stop_codon:yes gene_type:complete